MASPERIEGAESEDQTVHAANLAVVDEATAPPEVRQLYRRFRQEFGRARIPGILQCFATHPPLLEHMMLLAKEMLFTEGALGRQTKEMISTFVSALNHCAYCTDSHAFSYRMEGGAQAALGAVLACDLTSNDVSPKERTLLHFVSKVTENSRAVCPADIQAIRSAGWSDLQIAEAIHVTALFAAFNRVVNAFGLPSQELLRTLNEEDANGR